MSNTIPNRIANRIDRLPVPESVLGEGPVWSQRDQCLYYVDIMKHRVQAYWPRTKEYKYWQFDQFTGSLAECKSGGLIITLKDRIVRFDPGRQASTGAPAVEEIAVLEQDRPGNRLNDGKTDPLGRFWVGSAQHDQEAKNGRLWCVTADGQARMFRDGIGVSNSISFDDKRRRMYFADSMLGLIEQTTWNDASEPTTWHPFFKPDKGVPDGSCTDADGHLWNAEWGGNRVVRYSPAGEIDRVIEMPVSRPSCCTFGGQDYQTLFVTSARYMMTPEEDQQDTQAGSLFSVDLDDVKGAPAALFAL
jgi:sugar lactone lactonase YvrE